MNKILDKSFSIIEHYSFAINMRAYLAREILRINGNSLKIDGDIYRTFIKSPGKLEDFILISRRFSWDDALTVIDVGANEGGWAELFLKFFPNSKMICIEPLPQNYQKLETLSRKDPRISAINSAVSDRHAEITLFHNKSDIQATSVSAHVYKQEVSNYNADVVAHTVLGDTLDSILAGRDLSGPLLLKVDTQGHEPAVLRGAKATMAKADAAYIEASFSQFEDQPHGLSELVPMLSAAGLHLGAYQQFIGKTVSRYPYELNMVFVRDPYLKNFLGY